MIAAITVMRTPIIALFIPVLPMNSAVLTADVYLNLGNVIMKMTVKMDLMKMIVSTPHVLLENLLVPTIDVYPWLKYAMV
jgi:hypothetical protein